MSLSISTDTIYTKIYHWKNEAPAWSTQLFSADLRARQHASSRHAMELLLKEKRGLDIKAEDIQIENHQNIMGHPELKVSISHTKDGWAMAAFCDHEKVLGIGIDLEFNSRVIKSGIEKLYVNGQDDYQRSKEDLLKLWCFKEASFKALSPLLDPKILNKTFVLKDLIIKENKFFLKGDSAPLGILSQHNLIYQDKEFLVAKACLTHLPSIT